MAAPATFHVPEEEIMMPDTRLLTIEVIPNPFHQQSKVDDADTRTKEDTIEGEIPAQGGSREAGTEGEERIAADTQSDETLAVEGVVDGKDVNKILLEGKRTEKLLEQTASAGEATATSQESKDSVPVVSDLKETVSTGGTGASLGESGTAVEARDKTADSEKEANARVGSVVQQPPGTVVVSGSTRAAASPVPVIAHASSATVAIATSLKDGPHLINVQKENERIVKMAAEKLKVGEAELLSLSQLQQRQAAALMFAEGAGSRVSQVTMIPPIVDLSRATESHGVVVVGEGGTAARPRLSQMLNVEKQANAVQEEATKDSDVVITSVTKGIVPSMTGMSGVTAMLKFSPQQPVKKHWTTSWKPLSTAALEHVGLDSKGSGYWYDGGRNLFLSPPTTDTNQLPAEADMQLVCKSMVQWMAKLKELRSSTAEADSKLAQVIKDQFIARVRVATQRKPKDPVAIQRMIAQSQSLMKVQSAIANAGMMNAITTSSTASPQATTTDTSTTESAKPTIVPPSFPQGSILVVPHPHHPFQAVPILPVFANAAVIMPQNTHPQGMVTIPQVSSAVTVSNGNEAGTTSVIQSSMATFTSKEGAPPREDLPKESATSKEASITIASLPSYVQHALNAAGGLSDSRQPVALPAGISFATFASGVGGAIPTLMITVAEAVPLGSIDFDSKSIEITGEVPIRKVELDSLDETSNVADGGRLLPAMSSTAKEIEEKGAMEIPKEDETETGKEVEKVEAVKKSEEGQTPSLTALHGRTSQEVMSAKMLLSLTGRAAGKDWPISPLDKDAPAQVFLTPPAVSLQSQVGMEQMATVSIAMGGAYQTTAIPDGTSPASTPSTPSGRKRKQKPTPSAKASDGAPTPDAAGAKQGSMLSPTTTSKGRRIRKPKQMDEEDPSKTGTTPKRSRKQQLQDNGNAGKSREFTPEELLTILGIPPSTGSPSPAKEKTPASKGRQKGSAAKSTDKDSDGAVAVLQGSEASAKMQQLKAERESKPMKEYVIETDSDSDSSSSGTSSFSPNSGSSSDSSSDSSSEGGSPSETAKPLPKKGVVSGDRGRGRGHGRGRAIGGRNQRRREKTESTQSSSSDESSSEDEAKEMMAGMSARNRRGRGRGRGGAVGTRGGRQSRGQIVSIPTSLLTQTPQAGKKRRASGHEGEDKDHKHLELIPEGPIDLASFYSNRGGVDLGILSELTQSVKPSGDEETTSGGSRSKRTCVRVREEISKLQEILEDIDTEEPKAANAVKAKLKGRGSRGRGQVSGTGGGSDIGPEGSVPDVGSADSGVLVRKYRRPAYRSQFTHKRRKKRKKQPEEEALWQPARKRAAGEILKPVYVFSTNLANQAAEWVYRGKYDNIIQFHNAQPKGPGFLRLLDPSPQKKPVGGRMEMELEGQERKLTETTDSEEVSAKTSKPFRRRSSRLSTDENHHESPRITRLRSHKTVSQSADSEDPVVESPPPLAPPPPVRSSRRLRSRQRPGSTSPPPQSPPPPVSPPPPTSSRKTRSRAQAIETPPQRVTRSRRAMTPERQAKSPSSEREVGAKEQEEETMEESRRLEGETWEEDNRGDSNQQEARKVDSDQRRAVGDGGYQTRDDGSPSLQSPPLDMVGEGPYESEALSETNYTICHGTPSTKKPLNDISSPSSARAKAGWPPQQQQQQQRQAQSVRMPTTSTTEPFSPSGNSAAAPTIGGRPVAAQSPGVNATESVIAQQLTQDHHRDVNWGHANITPQFPPVPGGYPAVYNPGLHAMPYPPPGQAIPGANYPYPMPYPWPHAHPHGVMPAHMVGSHPKSYHDPQTFQGVHHTQEMLQQQRVAAATADGTPHSQHLSHHHQYPPSSLIQTWSSQQPTPSSLSLQSRSTIEGSKESMTSYSPQDPSMAQGQPVLKPLPIEKVPLGNAQSPAGFPPPPTLHQLPTSGSQPSLSHPVPHGFARGPHTLSPEHLQPGMSPHPHAAFPYPFEPGTHHSLSPMHMWHQPQMQAPPIRHLPGMHPAAHIQPHLSPHGMWYPHMAPLMAGPGIDPTGAGGDSLKHAGGKKGGKGSSKAGQMDGAEKVNANRNVNNNNSNVIASMSSAAIHPGSNSSQSLYAAQYQAQAFSQRQVVTESNSSNAFSVEQLASSHHKESTAYLQSRVARGATWTPPSHQSETHRNFSDKLGSAVISVQSANSQPGGPSNLVPTVAYRSAFANHTLPLLHGPHKRQGNVALEDSENMTTSAILERTRRNTEIVGEMVTAVATFPS